MRSLADLDGRIERYTSMVGDLADNVIKLTVVLVTQSILMPFAFLWLLAMIARGIARIPLAHTFGAVPWQQSPGAQRRPDLKCTRGWPMSCCASQVELGLCIQFQTTKSKCVRWPSPSVRKVIMSWSELRKNRL